MKLKAFLKFKADNFSNFSREILDLLIEFTYLAVIFLVPLWFAYLFPTYNIFEFNKLILFKVLLWLLFLFTAVKLIFYPNLRLSVCGFIKKYWLWPTVFIVGLSLSLFYSDNPLLSFYGSMERQAGLVFHLYNFFWFLLVGFNILTIDNHLRFGADSLSKRINRIVIAAVLSASLISVYGLLQILNIDFVYWPESAFLTQRIFSTLGQPNFLASWLLLVIPLSIYLGFRTRQFIIKFLYFLASALQIICLFLTGSRGGLVAGLFAGALYILYLFFVAAWSRRKKLFLGFGFVLFSIIFLAAVNNIWSGRISGIFDFQSGSVGARANFYSAAADAISTQPLFGYGLESGNEIFIKYYEPNWGISGDVGQSADRAHNLILDIILNTGFYGLFLFALLYYFFFALARDNIKNKLQLGLSLALTLGVAAYLFSLLFSFSIASGEIYFWLFLALLALINDEMSAGHSNLTWLRCVTRLFKYNRHLVLSKQIITLIKLLAGFALLIFTFWRLTISFQALTADYYFNKIYFALAKEDYFIALALDNLLKEKKINLISQTAYDVIWAEKLSELYPSITELSTKKVVAEKLNAIEISLPNEGHKNLLVKAKINNTLGRYELARLYLDKVIAITPHWPLVYMEQGKLSINQNDNKAALVAYNLALLNLPSINDRRLNDSHRDLIKRYQYFIYNKIGAIYEEENNNVLAEKYFWLAYKSDPSDYVLLKRIADTYYRRGDLPTAIVYTRRGLMRNPTDYKWSIALAALYYESGDKTSARDYIERASVLGPENQEILDLKEVYSK